jgi:hypothetical protein
MKQKFNAPTINRRDFLLAFAMGSTATIVMYKVFKPSRMLLGENSSLTAEHIKWKPSEYVHNWEKTLHTLFQLQYRGDLAELIFVDQNGNLIDHQVISTKDEIKDAKGAVIPAWTQGRERFDQKWLNAWRRKFYSRYPSIDFDLTLDQEFPKQMNSRRSVEKTYYNTNIERVLDYGSQNVLGLDGLTNSPISPISRIAYAKKVFSQSTQVGNQPPINLPAGIRKRLGEISYGIAGIESGFDNSQISPAKAQSVWQIMPSTFRFICKKLGLKADYNSLITTTTVANRYCEEIYHYFIRYCHDDFESIRSEFGFSEQYFENEFIFPCIVNAYHAGQGRLKKVVHWFAENYDQDTFNQKIGTYPDGYGYDLFGHMTRICYQEKTVYGYGRQSWEYFLRANGMAALIRQKYDIDIALRIKPAEKEYQPPEALLPDFHFWRKTIDFVLSAVTGLAIFKLSGVISKNWSGNKANAMIIPVSKSGGGLGSYKKPIFSKKRGFLALISRSVVKNTVIVLGCLLVLIIGFSVIRQHQPKPVRDQNPWGEREIAPISSGEIRYKYSRELEQELSALPRIFTKNPGSQYYRVKMPRHIQAKLITPWMRKHDIFKGFYRNKAAIQKAAQIQELIQLSYLGNQYYRCRTLGFRQILKDRADGINTKALGIRNHPDYLYAKPSTEKMIIRISELVNRELHEKFGLDVQYRIRLIVNSGIRDTEYNRNLPGSSPNSTHQLGMAVDFSSHGVDVIKSKSKTFIYLSHKQGKSVDKKHRVRYKALQALKFVLVTLHDAGKLFAIKEGGHYHVTDKGGLP